MDDGEIERLKNVLAGLARPEAAIPAASLSALNALAEEGHDLTIDMAASKTLGAPLVIARRPVVAPGLLNRLTPRQREVALLIADGRSNKQIARELGLSVATVKDHVHAVLTRLNLPNRAAVIAALMSA